MTVVDGCRCAFEDRRRKAHRLFQALLILSILSQSWLGMMIVHELGHVFAAWANSGTVAKVVLHPLEFYSFNNFLAFS